MQRESFDCALGIKVCQSSLKGLRRVSPFAAGKKPHRGMLFNRERCCPPDNFHNVCHEDNPAALISFKVAKNKEAGEDEISGTEENPGPLATANKKNKPKLTLALGSLSSSEAKTPRRHSLGRPHPRSGGSDEDFDSILLTPLSTSRLTASTRARRFSDTCTNIHQQLLYLSPLRTPDFSPTPSSGSSSFRACSIGGNSARGSFRGNNNSSTTSSLSPPKNDDAVASQSAIVPAEITWKDVRQCFAASCGEKVSDREFRLRRERFLAAWTLCALKDNPQRGAPSTKPPRDAGPMLFRNMPKHRQTATCPQYAGIGPSAQPCGRFGRHSR